MKRFITTIIVILIAGLVLIACIKRDVPEKVSVKFKTPDLEEIIYPADEKNVTIYYSENGEATTDLAKTSNGWKTNVTDYSKIKSHPLA